MMKRILLLLALITSVFVSQHVAAQTTTCSAPSEAVATGRDSMATIYWKSAGDNVKYVIQWRLRTDSLWKTEETSSNSLIIKGLKLCSEYVYRIKTMCSTTASSDYTEIRKFKTTGCVAPCTTPSAVKGIANVDKAAFTWSATGAKGYQVQFKLADAPESDWRSMTTTENIYTIAGLKACSKYLFKVRSICNNNSTTIMYSEWSSIISVMTGGCTTTRCEAPKLLVYQPTANGAALKWDAPNTGKYDIQWMVAGDSIWKTISGVSGNTYQLTGLQSCKIYMYRVRSVCGNNIVSNWSYAVRFKTSGCEQVCNIPKDVKVQVADTIAVLSWVGTGAPGYNVQYRMLPDTTWKTVISNATVKVLTGLKRCSKFEVRVQSVCTSTLSSAFTYAKFETGGCQSACSTPHYLKAQVVDVTTAILTWENTGARAYVVEIKTMMDSMSTSKFDTVYMNSYKISGLQKCKTYAYRVRAYCGNGLTGPSETFIFQTPCPPACVAPKIVGAILNSDTVGVVGWDALLNEAAKYEIQYRLAGDSLSQWISARTDSREYKLTALKRCAVYEIRVRRICSDILFSEWSYTKLETKGCTTNTCFMPTELRADSVSGGVIMYWAGTSGGKYEIQYRQSGIVVTDWKSQYTTTPGFKLQLPCGLYEWRVRKYCENGGVSDWAFGNKFMVANCVSPNPCIMPTLLESSLSGDSIAVVKWEGMLNSKYEIQYRPTTTTTETQWTSITTTNLKAEIKLGKCNIYEWRVRKICDNVTSDWAYGTKIITKGCITNGCTIPINIKVASINDSTFIKWEVLSTTGALFEVQYRNANDSIWKSLRSQSLYSVILGLQKCTKYIIRVRAVCADNQFSDWVETTFSFGCLIGDGSTEAALISNSVKDFSIYPNPGNEYLQVSYKLEQESEVNIDMLNLQGQVVSTIKGGVQGAGNYMQVFENLNDTKAGMYLIIVRANGKVTNTQKWIKQ